MQYWHIAFKMNKGIGVVFGFLWGGLGLERRYSGSIAEEKCQSCCCFFFEEKVIVIFSENLSFPILKCSNLKILKEKQVFKIHVEIVSLKMLIYNTADYHNSYEVCV